MGTAEATILMLALGAGGALLAVGALLLIKIVRGREAAHGLGDSEISRAVPARPMSQRQADRLLQRYLQSALWVFTVLLISTWLLT